MKPAVKQRRKSWQNRERKVKLDYHRPVIMEGGWSHHFPTDPPWYTEVQMSHDGAMTSGWELWGGQVLSVRLCITGFAFQKALHVWPAKRGLPETVGDIQRQLERFTGESWQQFFDDYVRGTKYIDLDPYFSPD